MNNNKEAESSSRNGSEAGPAAHWDAVCKTRGNGPGSTRVLDGFTLRVPIGSTWGVLAGEDSGKTTAVRVLLGMLQADSGTVEIFGKPASQYRGRRNVGFLPEAFRTFPRSRVRNVLRLFGELKGLSGPDRKQCLNRLTDRFDLKDHLQRRFRDLPRNLRRRVGLAQAVMGDPDLLILVEPTRDLDPVFQQRLYRRVDRRDRGHRTTLVFSRRLGETRRLCRRISVMKAGRIQRSGPPDAVLPGASVVD